MKRLRSNMVARSECELRLVSVMRGEGDCEGIRLFIDWRVWGMELGSSVDMINEVGRLLIDSEVCRGVLESNERC